MKNKNLNEEIKRMKSLFSEDRLYGNLVEQNDGDWLTYLSKNLKKKNSISEEELYNMFEKSYDEAYIQFEKEFSEYTKKLEKEGKVLMYNNVIISDNPNIKNLKSEDVKNQLNEQLRNLLKLFSTGEKEIASVEKSLAKEVANEIATLEKQLGRELSSAEKTAIAEKQLSRELSSTEKMFGKELTKAEKELIDIVKKQEREIKSLLDTLEGNAKKLKPKELKVAYIGTTGKVLGAIVPGVAPLQLIWLSIKNISLFKQGMVGGWPYIVSFISNKMWTYVLTAVNMFIIVGFYTYVQPDKKSKDSWFYWFYEKISKAFKYVGKKIGQGIVNLAVYELSGYDLNFDELYEFISQKINSIILDNRKVICDKLNNGASDDEIFKIYLEKLKEEISIYLKSKGIDGKISDTFTTKIMKLFSGLSGFSDLFGKYTDKDFNEILVKQFRDEFDKMLNDIKKQCKTGWEEGSSSSENIEDDDPFGLGDITFN